MRKTAALLRVPGECEEFLRSAVETNVEYAEFLAVPAGELGVPHAHIFKQRTVEYAEDYVTQMLCYADGTQVKFINLDGSQTLRSFGQFAQPVTALVPRDDGKLVAAGSLDGRLGIIRCDTDIATLRWWKRHLGAVIAIAWLPCRTKLVTVDDRQRLCVWDLAEGTDAIFETSAAPLGTVATLAPHQTSSDVFYVGLTNGAVVSAVIDWEDGISVRLQETWPAVDDTLPILRLAHVIHDDQSLLFAAQGDQIIVWTGDRRAVTYVAHLKPITDMKLNRSNLNVTTASQDGTIKVSRIEAECLTDAAAPVNWRLVQRLEVKGEVGSCFSDEDNVYLGGPAGNKRVVCWQVREKAEQTLDRTKLRKIDEQYVWKGKSERLMNGHNYMDALLYALSDEGGAEELKIRIVETLIEMDKDIVVNNEPQLLAGLLAKLTDPRYFWLRDLYLVLLRKYLVAPPAIEDEATAESLAAVRNYLCQSVETNRRVRRLRDRLIDHFAFRTTP